MCEATDVPDERFGGSKSDGREEAEAILVRVFPVKLSWLYMPLEIVIGVSVECTMLGN